MKNRVLCLVLLWSISLAAFSLSTDNFPDFFYIKEQSDIGNSFELSTKEKELGVLLRAVYKHGSFEFFDENKELQIIFQYANDAVIAPLTSLQLLQTKLTNLAHAQGFKAMTTKISEKRLKIAADTLNQRYREVYDDRSLGEEEKVRQFIDFGADLILSHTYTAEEEEAMLQFMLDRVSFGVTTLEGVDT